MKINKKPIKKGKPVFADLKCGDCFQLFEDGNFELCMKIPQVGEYNFIYLDNGNANYCCNDALIVPRPDAIIYFEQ